MPAFVFIFIILVFKGLIKFYDRKALFFLKKYFVKFYLQKAILFVGLILAMLKFVKEDESKQRINT